nr:hypothetical protein [Streptomyces pseudovenezuelae]
MIDPQHGPRFHHPHGPLLGLGLPPHSPSSATRWPTDRTVSRSCATSFWHVSDMTRTTTSP